MLRTLKWKVSVKEHIVIKCIWILSIFLWLALICQFPKVLLHIFTTHSTAECLLADEVIRSGSYDVKHKELKAEFVFFPLFLTLMLSHTMRRSPFLSASLSFSFFLFPLVSITFTFYILLKAVFQRCSVNKVFLEISPNSQETTCARISFLIKLQAWGLRPATLLKKRSWRRCFPVNFEKFPRTPFLT